MSLSQTGSCIAMTNPNYNDRCRELRHKDDGDWDGDADYGGDVEDEEEDAEDTRAVEH